MEAFCETCDETVDVEPVDDSEVADTVMCLACGDEFVKQDPKYKNYVIASVLSVQAVPKKDLKKVMVDYGEGPDKALQIVTNAKFIDEGDIVVVAKNGAIVPAGADPEEDSDVIVVKSTSVGGVKSEGMLCDSKMLGWSGGGKGALQRLPKEGFTIGTPPPSERPRND